jgi:lipoprotein-anchoring transpeptidase ErfK/SrfK
MRRIFLLNVGVIAGLLAMSTLARAAADISIFFYPPGDSSSDGRPLASPIPRETINFSGPYAPGSILINTGERRLYFVLPGHQAIKYGVGVGRPGFEWSGVRHIANKREWPDWTPPPQMLKRRPDLPRHMEGGIDNPLGARAMYLSGTLFRIHGSNEPDTIGQAVSSGCIRMTNDDVIDLYDRAKVGAAVFVLR